MRSYASWNLTVPNKKKPIPTATLTHYADEFYFDAEGGKSFRAPSYGKGIIHTDNSTYPRSELRQTLANGDDDEADWPAMADGVLYVLQGWARIDKLPKSGKLIWSQWHGKGNHPGMKGNATKSNNVINLYAHLRKDFEGPEDKPVVYADYKLGTWFYYSWRMKNGLLKLFINGVQAVDEKHNFPKAGYQFNVASYKEAKDKWYAKLGCYSQQIIDENDLSLGEGQVTHKDYEQFCDDDASLTVDNIEPATIEQPKPEPVPVPPKTPTEDKPTTSTPKPTEPVTQAPTDNLASQIDQIAADNAAGKVSKEAAKKVLNGSINDKIDAMPDGDEQKALYKQLKAAVSKLK